MQLAKCSLWMVWAWSVAAHASGDEQPRPVAYLPVERHNVVLSTELKGVLKFAESAAVMASWGAKIKKFHVKPGDMVHQGDLLAEVDVGYEAIILDYYRGTVRVAKARLEAARAEVEFRAKIMKRVDLLAERGLSTPSQLEAASSAVMTARMDVDRMIDQLANAESQAKAQELRIGNANFLAPIDGRVVEMGVNPQQVIGTYFAASNFMVARIAEPGAYVVEALALETQRAKVLDATGCLVQIPYRKNRVGCALKSVPAVSSKAGDPAAPAQGAGDGLYQVNVEFQFDDEELPVETEVTLVFQKKLAENVLAVPVDADLSDERGDGADKVGVLGTNYMSLKDQATTLKVVKVPL